MEPNRNPNPNMNTSNSNTDVDPNPHPNDWRTLFPVVERQITIIAVLDTYKSLLCFPDNQFPDDYLFQYKRSVVEFERAAFKEADNETDYLLGICRRMDVMMTNYLSAASSSNSKPSTGNDGKQRKRRAGARRRARRQ